MVAHLWRGSALGPASPWRVEYFCTAPLLVFILDANPLLTKTAAPICHTHGRRLREKRAGGWVGDQALQGVELRAIPRPLSCHPRVRASGFAVYFGECWILPGTWRVGNLFLAPSFTIWALFPLHFPVDQHRLYIHPVTEFLWGFLKFFPSFSCYQFIWGSGRGSEKFCKNQLFNTFFQSNLRKEFSSSFSF